MPFIVFEGLDHAVKGTLIESDTQILLDLPITEIKKRMANGHKTADVFEQKEKTFHDKVRQAYLNCAHRDPEHWCILDALSSVQDLTTRVMEELKKRQWLNS